MDVMKRTWIPAAALLFALVTGCADEVEAVDGSAAVEAIELDVEVDEVPSVEIPPVDLGQCKVLPDGRLCAYFNKLANHIRWVAITRTKLSPICNYQPFVDVYDAAGVRIARTVGPRKPGCHPGRLSVRLMVDTVFPDGRKACAGIQEGFAPLPGALAQQICVPLFPLADE